MKKISKTIVGVLTTSILFGTIGAATFFNTHNEKNFITQKVYNDVISNSQSTTDVAKIKYQASSNSNTVFAIVKDADGLADRLYWWGANSLQAGIGATTNSSGEQPSIVSIAKTGNYGIGKIINSGTHTLLLTSDGEVWATGLNSNGQLGDGSKIDSNIFKKINSESFNGELIKDIAVGDNFSMAITNNNKLYGWGMNDQGQLGWGDNYNGYEDIVIPKINELTFFNANQTLSNIQAHGGTGAVLVGLNLYIWGDNTTGQLGNGESGTNFKLTPKIPLIDKEVKFYELGKTVFAITSDGTTEELYTWGNNNVGQTGLAKSAEVTTPTLVFPQLNGDEKITQIKVFGDSAILLTESGALLSAGDNSDGQLGFGDSDNRENEFGRQDIQKIDATLTTGLSTVFLKTPTGELYTWGKGDLGQYGIPSGTNDETYSADKINKLFAGQSSRVVPNINNANILSTVALENSKTGSVLDITKLKNYFTFENFADDIWFDGNGTAIDTTGYFFFRFSTTRKYSGLDGVVEYLPELTHIYDYSFKNSVTTNITVKQTYDKSVLAKKWLTYVRDGGSQPTRAKMEEFFDLIDVPTSAAFTFRDYVSGHDGSVRMDITVDKVINENGEIEVPTSKPFPVELSLAKTTTKIIAKTEKIDKTEDEFMKSLALTREGKITAENVFNTYVTITDAPTTLENVTPEFYILKNSSLLDKVTGILKMTVWVTNYYDVNGSVINDGSVDNTKSHFPLEFQLREWEPSSVIKTLNPPMDVQVQNFSGIEGFNLDNTKDGLVQNVENLKNYLTLNNFSLETKFYLRDETFADYDDNSSRETVSYKLFSDRYYPTADATNETIKEKSWGVWSFIGLAQHKQTEFIAKSYTFPLGTNVVNFREQIIATGANDVGGVFDLSSGSVNYLKGFINFISPVENATYKLSYISEDETTGALKLKIIPSEQYDGNGDKISSPDGIEVILQLDQNPLPASSLSLKSDYPKTLTPLGFLKYVTGGTGNEVIRERLAEYADWTNMPDDCVITIDGESGRYVDGITNSFDFNLSFSRWIAHGGGLGDGFNGGLSLTLADQYEPTTFVVKSTELLKFLKPSQFGQKLINEGATKVGNKNDAWALTGNSFAYVSSLGVFKNEKPDAKWWIETTQIDDETGVLEIKLFSNHFSNDVGVIIETTGDTYDSTNFMTTASLKLMENSILPDKTKITTKANSPITDNVTDLLAKIKNVDGSWNLEELAKYVDGLNTIPTAAVIEDVIFVKTISENTVQMAIVLSGAWNGENSQMLGKTTFNFDAKVTTIPVELTKEETSSMWWIVIVSIIAVACTGGLGLIFFIYKKNKSLKVSK